MESNGVQNTTESTGPDGEPGKMGRVGKQIYNAMSSPVGLTLILILYTFVGATIFQAIEGPREHEQRKNVENTRRAVFNIIINQSRGDLNGTINVTEQLIEYETQFKQAVLNGATSDAPVWDFWGSFFFSATVYTTIGYGHIAPVTTKGRAATMVYAAIGIPLCLIVLSSLGKMLTRAFRYCWLLLIRSRACSPFRRLTKFCSNLPARIIRCKIGEQESTNGQQDKENQDEPVEDHFNLPPPVAVIIVILYIGLGTLIYRIWETEWSSFETFYFIFISVSTIGFGDVMPRHPKYFLASSVYVLIGLALVAMVANVIMEAMASTITVAKEKLGSVSKDIGLLDIIDSSHKKRSDSKSEQGSGCVSKSSSVN